MRYDDLEPRLTPEARSLFVEMVEVHQSATTRREFALTGTLAGDALDFWGDVDWQPVWTKEH